jgi:predicted metalloprotease
MQLCHDRLTFRGSGANDWLALAGGTAPCEQDGMRIDGHRRSDNIEDRGRGGGGGGSLPVNLLFGVFRLFGFKGVLIVGAVLVVGYFVLPSGIRQALFGGSAGPGEGVAGGSTCKLSPANDKACDFSRVVLASTEDVWTKQFQKGTLPRYRGAGGAYQLPTLVFFSNGVTTGGCGSASSSSGPFYCPADKRLYIDPTFYDVMEKRLKAPGDFAQAYVIAHEVGHHVQNLIGSMDQEVSGDTKNQTSVRVELQADCLAGVWGHTARASLQISEEDLGEALNAAHAIGDDTLGHANARNHTHGTSAQRQRWFRRGFESGDARQCDTFAVRNHSEL